MEQPPAHPCRQIDLEALACGLADVRHGFGRAEVVPRAPAVGIEEHLPHQEAERAQLACWAPVRVRSATAVLHVVSQRPPITGGNVRRHERAQLLPERVEHAVVRQQAVRADTLGIEEAGAVEVMHQRRQARLTEAGRERRDQRRVALDGDLVDAATASRSAVRTADTGLLNRSARLISASSALRARSRVAASAGSRIVVVGKLLLGLGEQCAESRRSAGSGSGRAVVAARPRRPSRPFLGALVAGLQAGEPDPQPGQWRTAPTHSRAYE